MKKIILTIVVAFAVMITGFFIFISSGAYDISQLSPHNRFTLSIIKTITHSSINKGMKKVVVPDNLKDTALIVMGFKHYNQMCLSCHAAPGVQPGQMVEGLYPKPPELYKYAQEGDAREFFWITKNGIKMTSMPAFKPTLSDDEIWAITAFVTQKLGKMTTVEYKEWMKKYAKENKNDEVGGMGEDKK